VREGNLRRLNRSAASSASLSSTEAGRLQKDGSSTFLAPANVTPQADKTSRVIQGNDRKSSVRSVMEMTRMIESDA
jgi:flagellar basal-body rod protein FlgF